MADVTYTTTCVNLEPASRTCHLTGQSCPFAPGKESDCADCRYLAKVVVPPDEFHVLVDEHHRPKPGKFAVKRCRAYELHEAAGVHVSALLCGPTPVSLMHAMELSKDAVNLSTPEEATIRWINGKFVPA